MTSSELWNKAQPPNYDVNINKIYPYSEVPYLGEYKLSKIPKGNNNLVYHVDYWGEGKIDSDKDVSGFIDCYNVNLPYQLISKGTDQGRKIPNRIPIESHTNCDTSSYIKDNSVILVTVTTGSINTSCAADIRRIINNVVGKVIVYGFDAGSEDITALKNELKKKALYHCPDYKLPNELQGLTLHDNYVVFLNVTVLKKTLFTLVAAGEYDNAVVVSKNLYNGGNGEIITEVVEKLYHAKSNNIMAYVYKLWTNGAQDLVNNKFPVSFKLIFNQDTVTIVNKEYLQALKLDADTDSAMHRLGWASTYDKSKSGQRVTWKFSPIWSNDKLTFKLYNIDSDMYLELSDEIDNLGDRLVWGTKTSDSDSNQFYLEPIHKTMTFIIINDKYNQSLKLSEEIKSEKRKLWGHNKNSEWGQSVYKYEERFKWMILPW